jgi:hypothetical protein
MYARIYNILKNEKKQLPNHNVIKEAVLLVDLFFFLKLNYLLLEAHV